MHEVGLMQQVLETAAIEARKAGAERVCKIHLRIGEMAGVVPTALRFAFEALCGETVAAGAEMEIELVPALCRCKGCNRDFEPPSAFFECPRCQGLDVEILHGRELELSTVEVL